MAPSERHSKIIAYGQAYELLSAALKQFPREMWQYKPGPERWSIHEIMVHLADSEANSYIRCGGSSPSRVPRSWPMTRIGGPNH